MEQFRILLSAESLLWCQSLVVAFEKDSRFQVLGSVNPIELIDAALREQPNVLLWKLEDESLPFSVTELKTKCPFTLLVVLVENPHQFDLAKLIDNGVRGCLPLRLLPRQIINAVELIVAAGIMCLPRLKSQFFNNRPPKNMALNTNNLTSREREVFSFLSKNYSNQEIATFMNISESTVKTHLRNVYKKINVRSRTEALAVLLGADIRQDDRAIHEL